MKRYEITAIPDHLRVRSIVAVLRRSFHSAPITLKNLEGERHDFPELIYVKSGDRVQLVNDTMYPLAAGQMMIYAPLDAHTGAGTAEVYILSFTADFGRLPPIYNRVISLTEAQAVELERIMEEGLECYELRSPGSSVGGMVPREGVSDYDLQRLKRDLELFLIDMYKSEGLLGAADVSGKRLTEREQFDAVVAMLRARLGDELSLSDIAAASSMSVSKLKGLFRKYAASGPIDFFIELKLERAKELIRTGGANLTEIAEALGFSSLAYFSRLFKSRIGVSPSAWESQNCGSGLR